MTLAEAETLARIIGTADSGCQNCVSALVDRANHHFPQFVWEMHGRNVVSRYLDTWEPYDYEKDQGNWTRPTSNVVEVQVTPTRDGLPRRALK